MVSRLIVDFGSVYMKLALVIEKQSDDYKIFTSNFPILKYFKKELTLELPSATMYLISFNHLKQDFYESPDYTVIRRILDNGKIDHLYITGRVSEEIQERIHKIFKLESIKLENSHYTNLSVLGINFLYSKFDYIFFDIPGQSIMNLFLVGHSLNSVSEKNYVSFKNNDIYPFLLANINEGMSLYKIESVEKFKRLGGI